MADLVTVFSLERLRVRIGGSIGTYYHDCVRVPTQSWLCMVVLCLVYVCEISVVVGEFCVVGVRVQIGVGDLVLEICLVVDA